MLDSAPDGSEIVLADGTYTSGQSPNFLSISKDITVRALNPRGAILDGQNGRRLFCISTSGTVVIEGLDLTRGRARAGTCGGNWRGGAVILWGGGTLTIDNVHMYQNEAGGSGGGVGGAIFVASGTLRLINSLMHSNTAALGPNVAVTQQTGASMCTFGMEPPLTGMDLVSCQGAGCESSGTSVSTCTPLASPTAVPTTAAPTISDGYAMDDTSIRTAVNAWLADATVAVLTYGPISRWDTSRVTDMGRLQRLTSSRPNTP